MLGLALLLAQCALCVFGLNFMALILLKSTDSRGIRLGVVGLAATAYTSLILRNQGLWGPVRA